MGISKSLSLLNPVISSKAHANPVWPHPNLVTYAKTGFLNKATFTGSGGLGLQRIFLGSTIQPTPPVFLSVFFLLPRHIGKWTTEFESVFLHVYLVPNVDPWAVDTPRLCLCITILSHHCCESDFLCSNFWSWLLVFMSLREYFCSNGIFHLEELKPFHSQQRLLRILEIEQEVFGLSGNT